MILPGVKEIRVLTAAVLLQSVAVRFGVYNYIERQQDGVRTRTVRTCARRTMANRSQGLFLPAARRNSAAKLNRISPVRVRGKYQRTPQTKDAANAPNRSLSAYDRGS